MTEFEQIVGRGTRIHEDTKKYYFTLIDFRKATNRFADPGFDGDPVQIYEPGPDGRVTPPDAPPTDDGEPIPREPGGAEAATKFFVNLSTVLTWLSVVSVYASFRDVTRLPVALLTLVGAYCLYRFACAAAGQWGEYVRAAFDLYRLDLLAKLRIPFTKGGLLRWRTKRRCGSLHTGSRSTCRTLKGWPSSLQDSRTTT